MLRLNLAIVSLATLVTPALSHCTLALLEEATANYVAAQSAGQISTLSTATYTENFKPANISTGILSQPLKIDSSRSIHDVTDCATYTEIIITDPAHPYVIGTQLRYAAHGEPLLEVNSIVTDAGDWLFNATGALQWSKREDWSIIPEEKRDTRATLKAAADAYLNKFNDNSVTVPFGIPCARLEGGVYTGTGSQTDSCDLGFPTGIPMLNRRYVIDPSYGSVEVFFNFGGPTSSPDSHQFRLLEGKIRYVHTMTVLKCNALPEDPCNA
ncbi:hypothetical protein DFP72DRAFT_881761 [Ephemerocybe angulata]|uniref:DUF8021 domain-containing protein n=1 Tax=Ephemerocybe angulata TaxID=980116 RepID=A0A8H6MDB0_9AGAR|nr:hypothetical protein DFP72DRAFT_881761 [Tulosesus angulatus]